MKILHRGAEAILFLSGNDIIKRRVKKGYRVPQLDTRLRKQRTRLEAGMLTKAGRNGIAVPRVLDVNGSDIRMERINGQRIKGSLKKMGKDEQCVVAQRMGNAVAALHSADIMHGDLTTSNMILNGDVIYLIDFGLSKTTMRAEDFAVDVFLFEEVLRAGHTTQAVNVWEGFMKAYKRKYANAKQVLKRMEHIRKRRRYRNGETV